MLAATGLLEPRSAAATKPAMLDCIRQMGVLQIDTINVVARSPYLVLWSRLGDYEPRWLDELLIEKRLFEYWAHAACFIPSEDYPLYRRVMLDGVRGWSNPDGWVAGHQELVERVLERIRAQGPVRSSDFEGAKHKGGWWNWKEEKMALEVLLTRGDLMVTARHNFQRIYDLRERVIPDWDDHELPSSAAVRRAFLLKTARCLGLVRASWASDYFRLKKTGIAKDLRDLAEAGSLRAVEVEGWNDPLYLHPDFDERLALAAQDRLVPARTTLLSPFDPLVWDRQRARDLFGFDYTIECYVPLEKRRFGYFSLPVLHRGALIGRLAAKAHRKAGTFEIHNLVLEPGAALTTDLVAELSAALRSCAAWHGVPQVVVHQCEPAELRAALETAVRNTN
jgi:uncharacterized protein YcaQ